MELKELVAAIDDRTARGVHLLEMLAAAEIEQVLG